MDIERDHAGLRVRLQSLLRLPAETGKIQSAGQRIIKGQTKQRPVPVSGKPVAVNQKKAEQKHNRKKQYGRPLRHHQNKMAAFFNRIYAQQIPAVNSHRFQQGPVPGSLMLEGKRGLLILL